MAFNLKVTVTLICVLIINSVFGVPWEPEARYNDQNWMNAHYSFSNMTLNNRDNIKVIFMGASITDWWPDHIFDPRYTSLGAVNYGISGDGLEHALWRLQNGEIDGLANSLKVILVADCGSNNVGAGYTADEISRGYDAVIQTIRERLPTTRILLMGLMPRDNGNEDRAKRLIGVNIKNSKYDTGDADSTIRYLDLWTQFSRSWGEVEPALFLDDQLHLTEFGYYKWAQIIDPVLASMLN